MPLHAVTGCSYLLANPELEDWSEVPSLPRVAAELLRERFTKFSSTVMRHKLSSDGETLKMLIQLQDGLEVESVIMSYDTTGETFA
jgi:adenine C2-methylase RlmN of 23S rRNA A2503 and tRNA A37